jgi:uncharacterized protein YyaL (SSP411 family)
VPNRLASSTSPYLLQHRDNPVDWWEWSPDAFAEARRRDLPVLLSVGYAACHWCHVMAHESFEDARTAEAVNRMTVPIKVDREERPDVDAVYLQATQTMTGQGGWPMTAFLTPDGEPFYCGTYFPRETFLGLVQAVSTAWRDKRADVLRQGQAVVEALAGTGSLPAGPLLTAAQLDAAASVLVGEHDRADGGFGGAPKFPPSMVLEFLLRHAARTGRADVLAVVEHTAERMARGGIYDQIAGGFARYSVDAHWVVPHFEKMLYDNALLLRVYVHLWRATGSALARRVAEETADFLLRDLRTPEGGFASALDADTDGVEGLTYVWTPTQLRAALGERDGTWAAGLLAVTPSGTFEGGASTLRLPQDPDDAGRWADVRGRLLVARGARPQPACDDKVVTGWNGLAIAALAESGALLDRPGDVAAAVGAADLLVGRHLVGGRLRRVSRGGVVGVHAGVLEDYGDVAEGLLALHQVSADPRWIEHASRLLDAVLEHFGDGTGGLYDTADDAEVLVRRPQDPTDNATPSGASAVAGALVSSAALTGSDRHRAAAEAVLRRVSGVVEGHPRFAGWAAAVGEAMVAGPLQVAVVGGSSTLEHLARMSTSPGAVVVAGEPDAPGVPLLAGRPLVRGLPAVYPCRGFVCQVPLTVREDVAAAVGSGPH